MTEARSSQKEQSREFGQVAIVVFSVGDKLTAPCVLEPYYATVGQSMKAQDIHKVITLSAWHNIET